MRSPFAFVLFKRGKRFKKFEAELPDALDLMVGALRVGHSLNSALSLVSRECPDPVSTEFASAMTSRTMGLELRTAMDNLTTRDALAGFEDCHHRDPDSERRVAGNLAEVLEKTGHGHP